MSTSEQLNNLHRCREKLHTAELYVEMAKECLLTNLAPRIYHVGNRFYMGCGFHYSMEQSLAHLLRMIAIPPAQSSTMNGNDIERLNKIWSYIMVFPVLFERLCSDVIEAEQSADELEREKDLTSKKNLI